MPWTAADMAKKKEGLSGRAAEVAAEVANKALASCLDKIDGKPTDEQRQECEASAIKQGLAVGGRMGESMGLTEIATAAIETALAAVNGSNWLAEKGETEKEAANRILTQLQHKLRKLQEEAEDMETPEQSKAAEAEGAEGAVSPQQVRAVLKFLWMRFGADEAEAPKPAPPAPSAEEAETEADEMAEVELAESASGAVIGLAEDIAGATAHSVVPLKLNVGIIRPGWGNAKDGHYYPTETLRRDSAAVFPGIKMYESDHRDDEKSTRTWVSTVDEITGFTEDGAPIGRVVVHDKNFAERLLALNKAGMLHKMECSILGTGKVRKGEVDGKKGKIVEAITSARSVDWVTRGGAGGHALNLAESGGDNVMSDEQKHKEEEVQEEEAQEAEVTVLSENEVTAILDESSLPDAAKDRLRAAEYETEEAVKERVTAEVQYLKEITEAGKPVMHGDRETVKVERMSEAEDKAGWDALLARHGLDPIYGGKQA